MNFGKENRWFSESFDGAHDGIQSARIDWTNSKNCATVCRQA